jgi:hypothetical protein
MAAIRLVLSIQQSIVADFLLGASSSTLTSKHKITMREVYAGPQNHFRSVTISRTQQSPLAGAHGIGIVWALTIAFEDFSSFPGKEWQLMPVFVLGIIFNGAVYDENRANLEEEIRRLRSMRGQLTRGCRTVRKDRENDLLQCQTLLHQLRSRFADQEKQILTQSREMEMIVSFESEIRANLFREMITLAKSHTTPRYSKNLYYAAVVFDL